ncbi:hypothetical protein ABZP36_022642 [Zizania latifolia]
MMSLGSAVVAGAAVAWVVVVVLLREEYAASFASRFNAPPSWAFPNPHLRAAYAALQAWKQTAIFFDPANFTSNWVGPNVCGYNGIFCATAPGGYGSGLIVAGIDLNHADIAGYLPASLPLGLPDLALIHLNYTRFCGVVPDTFPRLRLLHELDLSNNRFVGAFSEVVLALPSLRYLDLRFNDFEGSIPPALFDRPLDTIFLNSNRLRNPIPANLGNSPTSVVVLAHNRLGGCIPPSIGKMANTLNEIVLINDELTGCVPPQGPIPASMAGMAAVEELDVARNLFEGAVPTGVCGLVSLKNFTYTDNFITSRPSCAVATAAHPTARGTAFPAHQPSGHRRRLHHAILPGTTQGLKHSVLPVATIERHHSVVPLAVGWFYHTILPVPVGIHHPVLPIAAVELHNAILPLSASGAQHPVLLVAAQGLLHPIIPVTTLKLHHSVIPLASTKHATSVLHAGSTRTTSTDLNRQAGCAVRAAVGLVQSQPLNPSFLRLVAVQPTHRDATYRAPRLRAAHHASLTLTPLHPIIAIWPKLPRTDDANNNAAFATQLLAAISRCHRWPRATAIHRQPHLAGSSPSLQSTACRTRRHRRW